MLQHGFFNYRLPPGATATSETTGFSLWHLLAAQMLCASEALAFLDEANEAGLNTLLDDLRECMTIFPYSYKGIWRKNAPYRFGWTWEEFRTATAWKDPLAICEVIGLPLLAVLEEHELRRVHPVIYAAHVSSCRRLELFPEDW